MEKVIKMNKKEYEDSVVCKLRNRGLLILDDSASVINVIRHLELIGIGIFINIGDKNMVFSECLRADLNIKSCTISFNKDGALVSLLKNTFRFDQMGIEEFLNIPTYGQMANSELIKNIYSHSAIEEFVQNVINDAHKAPPATPIKKLISFKHDADKVHFVAEYADGIERSGHISESDLINYFQNK